MVLQMDPLVPILALHNVCAIHQGMFSTLEDIMSTVGGYYECSGGYHEYTRGCSVHWEDIMSTVGDV